MRDLVHDEAWWERLRQSSRRAEELFPTNRVRDKRDGKVYNVPGRGALGEHYELTVIWSQNPPEGLTHIFEEDFVYFESVPA